MGIVCFKDVSYIYPRSDKFALEEINFSIMEGEFLAVMGENGAGKTTFCKLINGIIPHISGGRLSGNVIVDEVCTIESSVPQLALKVGMVLDDPDAQLFTSSVRHEIAFGPENINLSAEEIKQRVQFSLSAVGLNGFEDRIPATLSGGEKQRLSIAAALAMKGKIIVFDEPLCRLDPQGAVEVMSVLKDIRQQHGITIVMAAHDSTKMAEYADRVCILKNGRVVALDTAKNIFANNALLEENGIQPFFEGDSHRGTEIRKTQSNIGDYESETLYSPVPSLTSVPLCEISSVIEIKNFCFKYPGGVSIGNINLSIADNDFVAIIGNNGCGKTTLLKNITGLLTPCSGDIFIQGKNTKELTVCEISKEAGFVMQNPDSQLFTDSVYNEVAFALKNMRLPKTEIKQRVEDALNVVGLNDGDAFPHACCMADRKKIVIACVLAMGCKIIIFDEVDTSLDYQGSTKIMDIAGNLHLRGFTIIFVTHNMYLVNKYAHRVIQISKNGVLELSKGKENK